MYRDKTFLAIISSRVGSKRLLRKNVLDLYGQPLIAWSIEAVFRNQYFDKIVVTSDDNKILKILEKFGVNIIKRPVELASDTARTFDVLKQVLENVEKYDYVVLLQATSPLRKKTY